MFDYLNIQNILGRKETITFTCATRWQWFHLRRNVLSIRALFLSTLELLETHEPSIHPAAMSALHPPVWSHGNGIHPTRIIS